MAVAHTLTDDEHLSKTADTIADLLEAGRLETIQDKIALLHPADVSFIIEHLSRLQRLTLFQELGFAIAPETLSYINPTILEDVLPKLDISQIRVIISALESDAGSVLLETLPTEHRQKVFNSLSPGDQNSINKNMAWPARSAGRLMQTNFVSVSPTWTVGQVLDYMRSLPENLPRAFQHIFLLEDGRLVETISLSRLLTARGHKQLSQLPGDNIPLIPADLPQEQIANIFRRQNLISAPVVDARGHMLGVLTVDDVVDVIDAEFDGNLETLTGSGRINIFEDPLHAAGKRVKWLLLNLLAAFLSVSILSFFAGTLTRLITLATLLPLVGSLGGNSGIQSMAVTVRTLGLGGLRMRASFYLLFRETMAAFLSSIIVAFVAFLISYCAFHNIQLSAILGCAMIIAMTLAAVIGVSIPLLLNILRTDPAVGSGVILTTSVDMISFFIFLGLATFFLLHSP